MPEKTDEGIAFQASNLEPSRMVSDLQYDTEIGNAIPLKRSVSSRKEDFAVTSSHRVPASSASVVPHGACVR